MLGLKKNKTAPTPSAVKPNTTIVNNVNEGGVVILGGMVCGPACMTGFKKF